MVFFSLWTVTWQLGLVEREINEILRGAAAKQGARPSPAAHTLASQAQRGSGEGKDGQGKGAEGTVEQRDISEEDVCPICQEELLAKHLPVTYCK